MGKSLNIACKSFICSFKAESTFTSANLAVVGICIGGSAAARRVALTLFSVCCVQPEDPSRAAFRYPNVDTRAWGREELMGDASGSAAK